MIQKLRQPKRPEGYDDDKNWVNQQEAARIADLHVNTLKMHRSKMLTRKNGVERQYFRPSLQAWIEAYRFING